MSQPWLLDLPAQQLYEDGTLQEPTVRRWDFRGFDITYNSTTGRHEIRVAGSGDWKESVKAATVAALPANTRSGNTLTANVNGAFPAIDGVSIAVGELFLAKTEGGGASHVNNGIYQLNNAGSAGSVWQATRHILSDESREVTPGLIVYAEQGAAAGARRWRLSNVGTITLNSTALAFVEDLGTGSVANGRRAVTFGMSPYTVVEGDYILACDSTGGPITINLQSAAATAASRELVIADEVGNAAVNNITVAAAGGQTIDGAATYVINANREAIHVYNQGTNLWKLI